EIVSNSAEDLKSIVNFSPALLPLFVVTMITPLAPAEPYKAAPLGPFITLTLSIELGSIDLRKFAVEIAPSITTKAWLSPVKERIPLNTTLVLSLTPEEVVLI